MIESVETMRKIKLLTSSSERYYRTLIVNFVDGSTVHWFAEYDRPNDHAVYECQMIIRLNGLPDTWSDASEYLVLQTIAAIESGELYPNDDDFASWMVDLIESTMSLAAMSAPECSADFLSQAGQLRKMLLEQGVTG